MPRITVPAADIELAEGEQYASAASFAWCQGFDYGVQLCTEAV